MMKNVKLIYSLTAVILLASCNKNVLDRPPLTSYVDGQYWRNEDDIRMYANSYYPYYFSGYNTSFTTDYTPVRGYTFSDDLTGKNVQANFESNIPTSRGSVSESAEWLQTYAGPTWDFAWVRKSNILLDRLDNVAKSNITEDAYKHWTGVARFFRGFEYSRLVSVFGNVPYFDKVVTDDDLPTLYKDRDDRGVVMDKVYDDFKYALQNIRENDGTLTLNKFIAAAFVSRFMLFEGTYQHYHSLDAARAKKYLEFAVEAAEIVMSSNKYNFSKDFKSLFSSESLAGHPEVLLYRVYDAALTVTHCIGSYQNGTEVVGVDANLVLIKSFLANDGKVWQNSGVADAESFKIADLVKTRDPRFEASFVDKALTSSATLLYGYKFASRDAITYIGKTYPAAWGSNTNTSDAPVMRLAEVVLNWIEAKAVLAEYLGGSPVTQDDIDKSINAIRLRPLDAAAIAKGVQQTAPLVLGALPDDPDRDTDIPSLIWEIRRERRMEFVFEHTRLLDLKRWKKLNYMDFSSNPDYFLGPWVNVQAEAPAYLTSTYQGRTKVKLEDGTIITYDGTNAASLVGFWMVDNAQNRNAFTDNVYLAPVGQSQIIQYEEKGYTLTQTQGW
ncbi:RagB/SusD family nutrient uptake outer membrane protein [Terrimonas sp.]|uniref:RagB/SusD family nutrient uptake outer membrane protein n=1 Tax=Terrimonas sp. TaxID=1914338 RepID=UPI000D51C070|nr:RagB/SusD family nutrient uptake outer membrane protein [Terrimonas sp.]PVD52485.1 RagB/SusD family nutrient uptake outer membrane protein [Terrimonas sp.]